jgi:tungstate transport system substrate-binding protein
VAAVAVAVVVVAPARVRPASVTDPMRLAVLAVLAFACSSRAESRPPSQTVRVAVIGGMMETGFWPTLVERFQRETGHVVELAAAGPKPVVVSAFKQGGIDLIVVHASDAMINLVADGLARDPQPWVRNDMVIMGPSEDPAGIKGGRDGIAALKKIIATKSRLLVHASLGADGVLHDLQEEGKLVFADEQLGLFNGENQRAVLEEAAAAKAYTMVGRIPVLIGKLKAEGMEIMVRGDPRMRRPYLVETSPHANDATRELARWLRSKDTQAFIATYGAGKYDDLPLFYPVAID